LRVITDFANRRVQYDSETNFGMAADRQKEWEIQIAKELDELDEYSAELN
jgi:hypothetical protein